MSDTEAAGRLVQSAFVFVDREWPSLSESLRPIIGVDLSNDHHARIEYFLAVLAAAEGQAVRSGLRVMVHETLRRSDPNLGAELYRSLRAYERAWENWRKPPSALPLPPLEFPQEALGIAFIDGADLMAKMPSPAVLGTYNLATVGVLGTLILQAALEVRKMCGPLD
jgi:hypothetical protein